MALLDTDLLVVQRPSTQELYSLEIGDLPIPDSVDVDLDYTPAVDKGTVTNTAGTAAEIPLVGVNAGLMEPDQAIKLLGIEVGAQVNVAPVTVSPAAPTGEDGDLWYNTSDGRLYIYFNDGNTEQWVDASPIESGGESAEGSVKLDDEGTQQNITGGGGLSVLGGITSEFGTDTAQLGNIAPLNDWSVYPARS